MDQEAHMVLSYLARAGVQYRVRNGSLQLRNTDPLTDHDRSWIELIKTRLVSIIDGGEKVTDNFKWSAKLDTPEHRARRLR